MTFESIDKNKIPETEQYLKWIEGYTCLPHRRTGSAEGEKSANYTKEVFESLGLQNVHIEETDAFLYENDAYALSVNGEDIPCYPINGTFRKESYGTFGVGEEGKNADIIFLNCGDEEDFEGIDVRGKVVVCDCPWKASDEETYLNWSDGTFKYDPDEENRIMVGRKTDSYTPYKWPYNYCRALQAGAVGFVGILTDYFADGIFYNEDYSDEIKGYGINADSLPALWVGSDAGEKLRAMLTDDEDAKADFVLQKTYRQATAKNVIGILPGMSKETILIHSHHDAVFTGAVQDASGMAEIMGLASYFSQIPQEQRQKTLMFAATDGHYTDYEGHRDFIARRKAEHTDIILDAVIEHVAKEVVLGEHNEPIETGEAELRMFYVTDKGELWNLTKEAVIRNDIRRTIMLPAKVNEVAANGDYVFEQDEVISDAYYNAQEGIPVVSILSPPMYLFHPMDRINMVAKEWLRSIGIMYAEIITEVMKFERSFKR